MVMPRRLGEGKREKKGRGGSARSKDLGTCREEGASIADAALAEQGLGCSLLTQALPSLVEDGPVIKVHHQ